MRFSFDWLKRHLATDLSVTQIAEKLTSIGLEVESVEDPERVFYKFRLVQIIKAERHPDADKLQVCNVVDGEGVEYQIVCGAKNARVGLKTVLATPGAVIPSTQTVLKKNKLRGVASEGMMCSFSELAMPDSEDGIIELDPTTDLNTPVGDALKFGGGIIDVSITPNRGDCLSVRGLARDLAAAGAGTLIDIPTKQCEATLPCSQTIICNRNDISNQYAPFMAFRMIRNVNNTESPDWLKSALNIAGINSISLIVDLANWFMLDTGRPLHIYDADKIDGDLVVRFAKPSEHFTDLKGNKHELRQDMLVSADNNDILCVLGVMGGTKAACSVDTKNIVIESAIFDPVFISKTGTFLNLTSDSRSRFERGIDSCSCISGLEAASQLIIDHCGGNASSIYTIGTEPATTKTATLHRKKLHSITGYNIDWNVAKSILESLGIKIITSTDDSLTVEIPSWRNDIELEEDLIEEILRINGYDKITEEKIDVTLSTKDLKLDRLKTDTNIIHLLASAGLSEIISYAFIKTAAAEMFKEDRSLIQIINPISADMSTLRPSLLPSLLSSASRSLNYGQTDVHICELGHVFFDDCKQETHVAALRAGISSKRNWLHTTRNVDVFDAKRDLLIALSGYGINEDSITIENKAPSYYHPYRSGTVLFRKQHIGYFGELHPKVNKLFDIQCRVVAFELKIDMLSVSDRRPAYQEKVFPKINRDFAFLFETRTSVGNLLGAIQKLDQRIESAYIFDCFNVGLTKKSIGITVTLSAPDRTLTDDEATEISEKIIQFINKNGGELRTK